jgi:hypothetical protein
LLQRGSGSATGVHGLVDTDGGKANRLSGQGMTEDGARSAPITVAILG